MNGMTMYSTPEIVGNVYSLSVKDWNRRIFDALIPLPQGTNYNAYLIRGEHKVALVDTVNPGFEEELEAKISQICSLKDLDYLVMNHAEPDHAGSVPYIMSRNERARLIATAPKFPPWTSDCCIKLGLLPLVIILYIDSIYRFDINYNL